MMSGSANGSLVVETAGRSMCLPGSLDPTTLAPHESEEALGTYHATVQAC